MTIGVGEDDAAAGLGQLDGHVEAGLVLRDVVLHDDLGIRDTQSGAGGLQTVDMGGVITGVLVVDADQADLDVGGGLFGLSGLLGLGGLFSLFAAGGQAQDHDQSEKHCKELLHFNFLLLKLPSAQTPMCRRFANQRNAGAPAAKSVI